MVFHLVRIGFGVGQHLAAGVDDGDASAGSWRSLLCDLLQRSPGRAFTRRANICVFCRSEVSISLRSMFSQALWMSKSRERVHAAMTTRAATNNLTKMRLFTVAARQDLGISKR